MTDLSSIGIATAFLAGIILFLSPCVLPLVPGYLSYVAGQSLHDASRRADAASRLSAVAMSVILMTGQLTAFSLWLLRTFPILGRIG